MDCELFAEIVGAENVLTGEAVQPSRVSGVIADAIALPGSRDEASRLILLAREQGWGVVPFGGGTRIDLGFPPRRLDLVLSTARLNRLVDYQPDDMTVTVEPGMTLAALADTLARRGQFLPLDPPRPERSTVGGVVAAAASGPWRAAYGTPRDWVIGCRVAGADGKEVRGGGQVVKNVAGYDLPKLYTGSFGTLGLLTEVTFKVMPRPPARGYALVHHASAVEAESLVARVMASDLLPSAVVLRHDESGGDHPWNLLFQFMHVQDAVDWQLGQLALFATDSGARFETLDPVCGDSLLQACRELPGEPSPLQARLSTTSSDAAKLASGAVELCRKHGLAPEVQAYASTGQVFVACRTPVDQPFTEQLRALARSVGAGCVFPRLPESLLGKVDPWGEVGSEMRLMRAIKAALDPTDVFSPGRFVRGL